MNYNSILVNIGGGPYISSSSVTIPQDVLTVPKANSIYLNEHGDKMKGVLDMTNNKIINLGLPSDKLDGINKEYFDERLRSEKQSFDAKLEKLISQSKSLINTEFIKVQNNSNHLIEEKFLTVDSTVDSKVNAKVDRKDFDQNVKNVSKMFRDLRALLYELKNAIPKFYGCILNI